MSRAAGGADRPEAGAVRVDKWLWAARLFKTRALAAEAVNGGKVHLNGRRVKASRPLHPGDRLQVHKGPYEFRIQVLALSARRGPAPEARALYSEDEASVEARAALREQQRLKAAAAPHPQRRPDKRARRQLLRERRR